MSGFNNTQGVFSAASAVTVVPSDATVFPTCRALYVGVAGNITARMARDGANQLFANVPVGIFNIQCDKVMATGTAATNMVALY